MTNTSLTYKKGDKKTFVEGYFNKKVSSKPRNVSASEAFVYDIANDQRDFFKPIFANETKYLPNVMGSKVVSDYSQTLDTKSNLFKPSFQNVKSLTVPPNKKSNDVIKFIVVAGVLFLVYQILTD